MTECIRAPLRSTGLTACVALALALGACASGGVMENTVPVAQGTRYVGPYAWGGLDRLVGRRFSWSDWTISSDGWKSFRWEVPGEVLVVEHGDSTTTYGSSRYTLDPATGVVSGYQLHSDGSLVQDSGYVFEGKPRRSRMRVISDHQYEDVSEEFNGSTWQVPYMGRKVFTSNEQRAANQRERDNFWSGLAGGLVVAANTYVEASERASSGPTPYYGGTPAPSSTASAGSAGSRGTTGQMGGSPAAAGSAVAGNSDRIIPIQFYYRIPMIYQQGYTENRSCQSTIVALTDRVDLDNEQSRRQAMETAGRYRESFLAKCNRLGQTDVIGNLNLTIHGMNTRRTDTFTVPSRRGDYLVTLP